MTYVTTDNLASLESAPPAARGRFGQVVLMFVALAAVCVSGLGLAGWPIWLGVTCLVMLILAVTDLTAAICLFLLLNPLALWMRTANPAALVLSGANSIWLTILIGGWLWQVGARQMTFPRGTDVLALVVFIAYGLAITPKSGSFLEAFLGFRSLIYPAFFYLMMRSLVTANPQGVQRLFKYLLLSCLLLAILQILYYYDYIAATTFRHASTLALEGGGRYVLGHYFERMHSLMGGGPSNAGIFLTAGLCLAVAVMADRSRAMLGKIPVFGVALFLAYAAFLSLSRSCIVVLLVGSVFFMFAAGLPSSFRIASLVLVCVLVVGTVFGGALSGESIIQAVRADAYTWVTRIPSGVRLIFGGGLTAPGGGTLGSEFAVYAAYTDAGWVAIWAQMGLPGLISMLVWVVALAVAYVRLAGKKSLGVLPPQTRHYALAVGAIAMSLVFGSPHTAAIMRVGTDILFYGMAAITVSICRIARDQEVNPYLTENIVPENAV
jgi:hypothetical protein